MFNLNKVNLDFECIFEKLFGFRLCSIRAFEKKNVIFIILLVYLKDQRKC